MNPGRSIASQILGWFALVGFWSFVSKQNHPTAVLNLLATSALVATFAVAVYVNHLVLIPGLLRRGQSAAYLASLLSVMLLLALACTVAIALVYDRLWGPDPRRFGFGTNFAMELAGVVIHVAAVAMGYWLWKLLRRGRSAIAEGSNSPCPRG